MTATAAVTVRNERMEPASLETPPEAPSESSPSFAKELPRAFESLEVFVVVLE